MGFFDTLKKLDFGKIGTAVGKTAMLASSFAEGYGDNKGGTGSKILSGLGQLDLGQIFEVAGEVKQQIQNVRKATQIADIPQQALATAKQQGFTIPKQLPSSQKQSTGNALIALRESADVIIDETTENIKKIDMLERRIFEAETKLRQYFDKQDQIGRGKVMHISAPLIDQIARLNQQLSVVTNKIVRDENSHERSLNAMSNTVKAITNSPSLMGGVKMYESRKQNYNGIPRKNIDYIQPQRQQPQIFQRSEQSAIRMDMRQVPDYRRYDNYRITRSPVDNIPKTKPIKKMYYDSIDEESDENDEDWSEEQYNYIQSDNEY